MGRLLACILLFGLLPLQADAVEDLKLRLRALAGAASLKASVEHQIWLDAGGVPIGAEQKVRVRGKALLVISFQSEQRDEFRFARVGDRLVTVRHLHEGSGSGGGESGQSKRSTNLHFS